jgi:hypothetical protein
MGAARWRKGKDILRSWGWQDQQSQQPGKHAILDPGNVDVVDGSLNANIILS